MNIDLPIQAEFHRFFVSTGRKVHFPLLTEGLSTIHELQEGA